MDKFDIAIIGGGASGLTAGIVAARKGKKVVILEKMPRIGKKITVTGNGRCNLTNADLSLSHYYGSVKNLQQILDENHVLTFMDSIGVACREENGCYYPQSNTAFSVLDALRLELLRLNVSVVCDCTVTAVTKKDGIFCITADKNYKALAVIVAAGGNASPAFGSSGDGTAIAKSFGISVTPLFPTLTSIKTDMKLTKGLKGIRVLCNVSAYSGGKLLKSNSGEVQFGDGTLSGICIFNLSRLCNMYSNAEIVLDLMPNSTVLEVEALIRHCISVRPEVGLEDLLTGLFAKRICLSLLERVTTAPLTAKASVLTASEVTLLSSIVKSFSFKVLSVSGFQNATATAGGVSGEALTATLEAKTVPNLYFCGESVDVDGDCGGYNLTFAFASGMLVGSVAGSLR